MNRCGINIPINQYTPSRHDHKVSVSNVDSLSLTITYQQLNLCEVQRYFLHETTETFPVVRLSRLAPSKGLAPRHIRQLTPAKPIAERL